MTPNLCCVERLGRVAIGLGLMYIAAAVTSAASELLALIGIITCVTATVGWCPICDQLGVSSQTAFASFLERMRQRHLANTMLTPFVWRHDRCH